MAPCLTTQQPCPVLTTQPSRPVRCTTPIVVSPFGRLAALTGKKYKALDAKLCWDEVERSGRKQPTRLSLLRLRFQAALVLLYVDSIVINIAVGDCFRRWEIRNVRCVIAFGLATLVRLTTISGAK